ncbi:MAG TPA: type II toxin-antitoxin system RnlA family toxin [Stenomitos sp.]
MSYKSLNIDRDKITELLACYNSNITLEGPKEKSKGLVEYSLSLDGKMALIHFYYNNDGTTTITHKVGKNQDLSEDVARYIKENAIIDERKNFSLAFRGVKEDLFKMMLDYLTDELKSEVVSFKDENGYRLIKIKGKFKDLLTYKHYDNGTLQIQGKPLYLYLETIYFLTEFLELGNLIEAQSLLYKVKINPTEISDELRAFLPRSYEYLDAVHIKVLTSALVLKKLDVPLDDYSPFAYPALRALEGYLKKLLAGKGITIGRDGFGELFAQNNLRAFILRQEYKDRILCPATSTAVQDSYNYLHKHRHSLFHAGASSATTRIIDNKAEADEIISTVLSIIDDTYYEIIR